MREVQREYDFVVVGGGLSGLLAALAAARGGVKTALVHNRSVLGGNASSEFRMHICGADDHMSKPNLRETGILEEILLENKRINPEQSWALWDNLLWSKCKAEPNLDLYLDTSFLSCETEQDRIRSIICYQGESETYYYFKASFFCDASGDGTLGFKAGALYSQGRDARATYGDSRAPEIADNITMGSSMMFQAKRMPYPIPFEKPSFSTFYSEEELKLRDHSDPESGYWWIELGGDDDNTIDDAAIIHDKLTQSVYGIWDHIKNSPSHDSENLLLDWVSPVAGKRESRRLLGDYVLKQSDIETERIFEDAVVYGGWPMDIHTAGGINTSDDVATVWNKTNGAYTIPYRCYYSKNIPNLFMAGRNISASHVAFSSSRVMATCAIGGQAVGTAVALAIEAGYKDAKEVSKDIKKLQQTLIKNDCYIPGFSNESEDIALKSKVIASSGDAMAVINGISRSIGDSGNYWQCAENDGEKLLTMKLERLSKLREVRLFFDSNLSREITPSIINSVKARQVKGTPPELVESYRIRLFNDSNEVYSAIHFTKGQRFNVLSFDGIEADALEIKLLTTYGTTTPKVFEIRVDC